MTSRAIGVLTALQDAPDAESALPLLHMYLQDGVSDMELYIGMTNLAVILLVRLEKMAGRQPLDELAYLAERYGER